MPHTHTHTHTDVDYIKYELNKISTLLQIAIVNDLSETEIDVLLRVAYNSVTKLYIKVGDA